MLAYFQKERGGEEKTPLMIAALKGARESVCYLLSVGANANILSQNSTALQCAISSRDSETIDILCDFTSLNVSLYILEINKMDLL